MTPPYDPAHAPLTTYQPINPTSPHCAKTEEEARERAARYFHEAAARRGMVVDPASIREVETVSGGLRFTAYYLTPEQLERSA